MLTKTETTHTIHSQMLPSGPFSVHCGRGTQQVPFLSFYLCCDANIIILTVNLEKWSSVRWIWKGQWAKFSFLQIAALELFSWLVRLCVPVSWRQPQCWRRDCTVTEAKLHVVITPVDNCAPEHLLFSWNLSFKSDCMILLTSLFFLHPTLTSFDLKWSNRQIRLLPFFMSFDSPFSPSLFILGKDWNPFYPFWKWLT